MSKIRNKERKSALTTPIQHHTRGFRHCSKTEKAKGNWIGKQEIKLSLSPTIQLSMQKIWDLPKELLELINEFNKVAGYKINTQKPTAFTEEGI